MSFEEVEYTPEEIKEARTRLWYMGDLRWKLGTTQTKILDFWENTEGKLSVLHCSRRLGKSYFLTILACQQCLRKPNSTVVFLAPEQKQIIKAIRPLVQTIFEDAPPELRPEYKTQRGCYVFPNGSLIYMSGTDGGREDNMRGIDSDLSIIDEAAFTTVDLKYIIRGVLVPCSALTRGKIILSSSSPKEPDHDFVKYMETAEAKGNYIKVTILDAIEDAKNDEVPLMTQEVLEDILLEYPSGMDDDDFRREYMCDLPINSANMIIPEFDAEAEKELVVDDYEMPPYCDKYVGMDIGFVDLTGLLFAYYDFLNNILVFQDEIVMNGPEMTTQVLAGDIILKEASLWTNEFTNEIMEPFMRVADNNNLILINDLQQLHGINFCPTAKDDRESAINQFRMMVANKQIRISPKCKTLISHMKYGTWNKKRTNFNRSKIDGAHYDLIMAAVYLIRNVQKNNNPYPKNYNLSRLGPSRDVFVTEHYNKNREGNDVFKKLFQLPKRK